MLPTLVGLAVPCLDWAWAWACLCLCGQQCGQQQQQHSPRLLGCLLPGSLFHFFVYFAFSVSLLSAVAVCQPKLLHSKLSISQWQGKSCNFQLSPQLLAVSPSLDLPGCLSLSFSLYVALSLSSDLPAVRNYTAATSFLISCRTFAWHFHLPPLSSSSSWLCI